MPKPTIFSYSLQDAVGVKASHNIFVSYDAVTETISALLATAAAYGGLIDAVTGMKILEFNVSINGLPDPAWKAAAIANIDAEQTLLETFNVTDTTLGYSWDLPGLRDTLINASGEPILTSGGAIDTLNDAIVGNVGTGVAAQNPFLLDLVSLRDASVSFRKHRRQRRATSIVVG